MLKEDSVQHIVGGREVLVAVQSKFVTLQHPIVLLLLLRQTDWHCEAECGRCMRACDLRLAQSPEYVFFLGARRSRRGESCREMTSGPSWKHRISSHRRKTHNCGSSSHVHAIFIHRFGYLNLIRDWGNRFGKVHAATCGEERHF